MQAFGGVVALLLIAYLCSSNRKAINWKTVGFGLLLQFVLALSILKLSWVQNIFNAVGKIFVSILDFTAAGSVFLFGDLMNADTYGFIFVFQILPTIIFFAALTSLLFYLGVLQFLVKILAKGTAKLLNISGAESLSVIGNIFLGQTEAPLLIKAYLPKMNRSEMLLVMVGGMATVAGGVLAAYIGFLGGDDPVLRLAFAKHLLAASVMAAPGAIVVAKMLFPQTKSIDTETKVSTQEVGSNMLDAIANGTLQGVKLAANIGGMLLVFVALIAMANGILFELGELTNLNGWIANWSSYDALSIEALLGTLFAPIMWLIGVPWDDLLPMGQLLGIKLAASEFVGYIQLAELKNAANEIHFSSQKSIVMATYMLCGFANFASIGIQIGGIGGLAPNQREVLSRFGFRAVLGGTIASLLSATLVGALLG
jgi:CNT family concentrative nucleoside transporter